MNENMKKEQDYDIQQLMNITGQTAMNLSQMSKQMGVITTAVSTMQTDIDGLVNRMDNLELKEEITTTQEENIKECACKRVISIIGDDPLEKQKYFRIFIQSLYKDARRFAGLGSKISRTRKCDYQRCIDCIEAWIPECGCSALRARADANARARIEAREMGYVN